MDATSLAQRLNKVVSLFDSGEVVTDTHLRFFKASGVEYTDVSVVESEVVAS
jgi:hypothetical protein